jgi:hypothetical protein
MGIDLRCCERSVTEQFLDASQVRAALQQMSRCGVPQPVRPEVSQPRHRREPVVYDLAGGPRIESATASTE